MADNTEMTRVEAVPPRLVYFEHTGRTHPLVRDFLEAPPSGYSFVTRDGLWEKATNRVIRSSLTNHIVEPLSRHMLPVSLLKAWLETPLRRAPVGTSLTFAYNHLVFRREPWIPFIEWVTMLAGFNIRYVWRLRNFLRSRLMTPDCRAVITWSECSRRSLLMHLDSPDLASKVHVLPLATRPKAVGRPHVSRKPVRLLFVGSGTVPQSFDLKGGKEAVEAFRLLRERFPSLELTVRSDVPREYRDRYRNVPGLRILDRYLTPDELQREFLSADIFIYPAYTSHDVVVLDAMSYGLPVVTSAVADRPEVVEDGVTGFLVPQPAEVPSYEETFLVPPRHTVFRRRFEGVVGRLQPQMVKDVADRTLRLIEDSGLRERMGRAAKREIDEGRLSVHRRNAKLKAILDAALDGTRKLM